MAGTLFKRDVELQTGKKWEDWIKQGEGGWDDYPRYDGVKLMANTYHAAYTKN